MKDRIDEGLRLLGRAEAMIEDALGDVAVIDVEMATTPPGAVPLAKKRAEEKLSGALDKMREAYAVMEGAE